MSGIVGIYHTDGRAADAADVRRMLEPLAHRGPDSAASWAEGPVGLGHRMLATTPESLAERLPHVHERGDLAITADCRIDNREELIAALGLRGRPAGEIPDSVLILAAYERWGERSPERLLGDFAFAIWDRRRRLLFCARDHMGVKPFIYHHAAGRFLFASEVKGILAVPGVEARLNEAIIADHLLLAQHHDREMTYYAGMLRLPAAHTLVVSPDGLAFRCYWALDPEREVRLGSDREYEEAFREIFLEAVRCRLRSAHPVGSMLSGGLDSSSIAAAARDLRGPEAPPLPTFSGTLSGIPESDEREFAEAVVATGGFAPHFFEADRVGHFSDFERLSWHLEEPWPSIGANMFWGLYRLANQQGVRVLLDGFDGDTAVFHGMDRLAELGRRGRWITLARELDALHRRYGHPRRGWLWHHVVKPMAPMPLRRLRRVLRRKPPTLTWSRPAVDPTVNPEFARRFRMEERVKEVRSVWTNPPRSTREGHHRRLAGPSHEAILEWLDRLTAAHSLELRYPYYDRRLLEFCLALPADQKFRDGWWRSIQRRALGGILPDQVRWRLKKGDLFPAFKQILLTHDKGFLEEVIFGDLSDVEQYVVPEALREAYRRYLRTDDHLDTLPAIYTAVWLTVWLRYTGLRP